MLLGVDGGDFLHDVTSDSATDEAESCFTARIFPPGWMDHIILHSYLWHPPTMRKELCFAALHSNGTRRFFSLTTVFTHVNALLGLWFAFPCSGARLFICKAAVAIASVCPKICLSQRSLSRIVPGRRITAPMSAGLPALNHADVALGVYEIGCLKDHGKCNT